MAQARSRNSRIRLGIAEHLTGIIASLLFLAPIVWTVLSAFKPSQEARQPPLPPWPTTGFSVENYGTLNTFGDGLWLPAQNSIYVSVMTVVFSVIVSVLAGYGFSRFRFPFKDLLFVIILSTIMIPFQSILTPIFLVLTKVGLHNTLTGLVFVYVTLQLPFSIFMMRNAFDAVPREIEEAARMDGANNVTMLLQVMLPLVWPGIVTIALFAFLGAWNEFLAALVLMTDQSKFTLPIMMTALQSGRFGAIDWGAVQAGVTVMMVPCLILFLALQRFYIRGLMAGAVK
ncbi:MULTISPECIES: carbohydrate ABC transporter permease [unclassified Mesorhizobium]|uniref:carbohydrate ABC transporter permease n=1 Tax=unclassified Mesorhizobium TaxID=325217 RepID=UPI000FCC544E|nr:MULTISPECIES: carbohydrate ABC transporter permease [unclassified Mesorhizobium]RUW65974.1 carbohydrate ABC transporter permease [Mesorhizobium sp. M4B.F.Ca.ET.049.02.1.2]RVD15253.1 carbohydrate ABC transporter permease [Mesorhizobium sp. M4B.F.Ca.ET.017.02.2.1]RWF63759.1 MAG: carbohydrate ABC transporter permease [Mesorhizobium sp.]TGQ31530.1 carbohydrate ABC transporter permease [Mesorhizobium sp. M4B.F.Ca.ET.214.01.1.1]TGQ57943.1 carbohydrate ABC transporter permease [Mesorhizobium sp. M